jgi:hypothetical protein
LQKRSSAFFEVQQRLAAAQQQQQEAQQPPSGPLSIPKRFEPDKRMMSKRLSVSGCRFCQRDNVARAREHYLRGRRSTHKGTRLTFVCHVCSPHSSSSSLIDRDAVRRWRHHWRSGFDNLFFFFFFFCCIALRLFRSLTTTTTTMTIELDTGECRNGSNRLSRHDRFVSVFKHNRITPFIRSHTLQCVRRDRSVVPYASLGPVALLPWMARLIEAISMVSRGKAQV